MTKVLTPSATYGANPTFPEDGVDPETAAGLEVSIQCALNRAELAKSRLDAGVTKIRTVADITALKALTGQATGDHAIVKDRGLFEFDSASALSTDDVNIVQPTAGTGRWQLSVHALRGTINGIASLDANSKVPSAQLRGHLVSTSNSTTNPSASGTLSSPGPFGVAIASVSLTAGQCWDFFASFSFSKTTGTATDGTSAFLALLVVQPDTSGVAVPGSNIWTSPASVGVFLPYAMRGRFIATQSGTHSLKVTAAAVTSSIGYQTSGWSVDSYVLGAP